ncbi:MAG: hypothetical protein R3E68_22215 [Burkholderiaceae bacterium]
MSLITDRHRLPKRYPAARGVSKIDPDWTPGDRSGAWLTFDSYGKVSRCSEAMALLANRDAGQINGTTIRTLIPELPINPRTPGQNIGRLMMSYIERERPLGIDRNGAGSLLILATIRCAGAGGGRLFVLECRRDAYRPFAGAHLAQ